MSRGGFLARFAYGLLFVVALPAGLVAWAQAAAQAVPLPPVQSTPGGLALITFGLLLLVAGAHGLMVHGAGLPMNPFPPLRFVRTGIFRWIRNPMYIGFGLVCAGASIAAGDAAGLWLVTPAICLCAAALVYGFERQDLTRRFGPEALSPPLLSLPRGDDAGAPLLFHRVAVFAWIFVPWLAVYYGVQALGRPPDAFGTMLPLESNLPVLQWTELFYFSAYLFIPLTPLFVRTRGDLRRFAVQSGIATALVTLFWLTIPVIAVNRPFLPSGFWGRLLAFEQEHSNAVAAFPAFHVLWTLLAAEAWSANARATRRREWAWAGWSWAVLITTSCITTGMHTLIDVAAAILLYPPLRRFEAVWERTRGVTERIANSWKEWRIGPLRLISHGLYAAAAACLGLLVAGTAAGPALLVPILWTAVCVLIGSALWAQALEGSAKLLRPFGWFGGLLGGVAGVASASFLGAPTLPMMAALAIGAPWIQLLGRLRCLVQGCCHGGRATMGVGIRYDHPRSRVTHLAGLAGVPIHATPLYSILGNAVIALLLLRLRSLGAADGLIAGVYLILSGIARFVEEAYRGEPQTPILGGLRIYQWLAIASVVSGAVCTTLPAVSSFRSFSPPTAELLLCALALAVVSGLAMGADFPKSNWRFSRLGPAD